MALGTALLGYAPLSTLAIQRRPLVATSRVSKLWTHHSNSRSIIAPLHWIYEGLIRVFSTWFRLVLRQHRYTVTRLTRALGDEET